MKLKFFKLRLNNFALFMYKFCIIELISTEKGI